MGWDLHIAPENITYLYEFDLVLGPLIPGMGSIMCYDNIMGFRIVGRIQSPKSEHQQLDLINYYFDLYNDQAGFQIDNINS